MTTTISIDDTDSRISNIGENSWRENGVKEEFGSTTHGATGNQARATLTFTGSFVVVYGTVAKNTPGKSTYSIDGLISDTYVNPVSSSIMYQQVFYQSPQLEDKQHELTIVPSFVGLDTFWLDYITVTKISATSQSAFQTVLTTTSNSTITIESTSRVFTTNPIPSSIIVHSSMVFGFTQPSFTLTQTISNISSTEYHPPPTKHLLLQAIIASCVVGGIFILILIAFLIRRNYRKDRHRLVATPLIISLEPLRTDNPSGHNNYLFHESPGSGITCTRSFNPPNTNNHVSPEAPPTYSEHNPLLV